MILVHSLLLRGKLGGQLDTPGLTRASYLPSVIKVNLVLGKPTKKKKKEKKKKKPPHKLEKSNMKKKIQNA